MACVEVGCINRFWLRDTWKVSAGFIGANVETRNTLRTDGVVRKRRGGNAKRSDALASGALASGAPGSGGSAVPGGGAPLVWHSMNESDPEHKAMLSHVVDDGGRP